MICADLVLVNGAIHTLSTPDRVSAMAVAGNHIVAVGDDATMRALAGPQTTIIDLAGRSVVPGMIDAHLHLAWFGLSLAMVNLDGATSLDDCLARVSAAAAKLGPAATGSAPAWIRGNGWNHNAWSTPVFPDRHALDRVAPASPVLLRRKDGHSIWVNTLALQMAGVMARTPDPAGGTIDRDPVSGEPTGILREDAVELVERILPEPGPAELETALLQAQERALAVGLTGVHTMEGPDVFSALQRLHAAGTLALRVFQSIPREHLDEAIGLGLSTGFGNDHVRLGGVKLFADGSLGSATAAMLEDYVGQPGNRGVVTLPKDEMRRLVGKAVAAGIWPVIHAIGDRANHDVLDVFAEAQPARAGLRCRIEHVQVLHPDDVARLARLGVIASMQPVHCTSDRDAAVRLWGDRCRYAYAWRSVLQSGAALAFGSDCPVETISPLAGIHAAVTRQRAGEPDVPSWYPQECLTVEEALRGYTLGAAFASGEENLKGSLEVGKLADMVVLSHDILAIPPQEILMANVEMTIVGGKIAYKKE